MYTNYKGLLGSYGSYITANVAKLTSNIAQFIRPILNSALTKLKPTKLADYLVLGVAAAGLSSAYILKDQLLHKAVKKGYLWAIKPLIAFGADVNAKDFLSKTLLHKAVLSRKIETIKELIKNGANVNAKDGLGLTPLHHAAIEGYPDAIKVLVKERGADVNAKDGRGLTPLHRAAENGQTDAITELVDQGADVNAKNGRGFTPLHWAAAKGHLAATKALIESGAKVDAQDKVGNKPIDLVPEGKREEINKAIEEALRERAAQEAIKKEAAALATDSQAQHGYGEHKNSAKQKEALEEKMEYSIEDGAVGFGVVPLGAVVAAGSTDDSFSLSSDLDVAKI